MSDFISRIIIPVFLAVLIGLVFGTGQGYAASAQDSFNDSAICTLS